MSALALCGYLIWEALGGPASTNWLGQYVLYQGALLLAGVACLTRAAVVREHRGAWILFGVGLVGWTAGDIYWYAALENVRHIPYPSLADAGYLSAVPCFFAGIALLARQRIATSTRTIWFDGAIAALAAASAASALLGPALVGLTRGETSVVLTNLAYPVGDVLLVAFIAGLVAMSGARHAMPLVLIGAGLLAWTVADGLYLWLTAHDQLSSGYLDALWPVGALIIAASAVSSARSPIARRVDYRPGLFVPVLSTFVAVAVLVWDHFQRAQEASVWLGAATLLLVAARLVMSFRENERLVATLHGESLTDQLTGVGNRRALMNDLHALLAGSVDRVAAHEFVLFDLDGFKSYNDSFGHPAGDALLKRLGAALTRVIEPIGSPYRLGGDEFCVLVEIGKQGPEGIFEPARAALTDRGEGFTIGASGGTVVLPHEASTPSEVLRLADKRLYAEKARRSTRTGDQTRKLLMNIVQQREPALAAHVDDVASLAASLGRSMRLDAEDIDVLRRAAELHDIGKIAIPDDILHRAGPLTAAEWDLMNRLTLIGERLLSATPALAPVAAVVRSTHERWDGAGYPDRLAAEEIPLLARIIFVCDAFEAMRANRPYKDPMSVEQARRELVENAGKQFDPQVVDVFCAEILPQSGSLLGVAGDARMARMTAV